MVMQMNQKPRQAEKGRAYKPCETCPARIKIRIDYLICDDCVALNNLITKLWSSNNAIR